MLKMQWGKGTFPPDQRWLSSSTACIISKISAFRNNSSIGSSPIASSDEAAEVAGFNLLFGTNYSQEVTKNSDPSPHPSDVDHNNRDNVDASDNLEEPTAATFPPVTAEGGTDTSVTARCTSTTNLVEGKRTDDRGGVFQAPCLLLWNKAGGIKNDSSTNVTTQTTSNSTTNLVGEGIASHASAASRGGFDHHQLRSLIVNQRGRQ